MMLEMNDLVVVPRRSPACRLMPTRKSLSMRSATATNSLPAGSYCAAACWIEQPDAENILDALDSTGQSGLRSFQECGCGDETAVLRHSEYRVQLASSQSGTFVVACRFMREIELKLITQNVRFGSKADIVRRKMPCPLHTRKRKCAVQLRMSGSANSGHALTYINITVGTTLYVQLSGWPSCWLIRTVIVII